MPYFTLDIKGFKRRQSSKFSSLLSQPVSALSLIQNMKYPISTLLVLLTMSLSVMSCKSGSDDHQGDNEQGGNQNGFETEAKEYESPDRVIWQKPDLVIQLLGDVTGKTIADLGAGTGISAADWRIKVHVLLRLILTLRQSNGWRNRNPSSLLNCKIAWLSAKQLKLIPS
jgi:hypothetical protein